MTRTYLSHDAFARTSIVRETVETDKGCTSCGQKRPSGKLFRYGQEADDSGRVGWWRGLFCSASCRDMCHN